MATALPDYYCHKCQVHIGHVTNFRCPHCRDTFIEETPSERSSTRSRGVRQHSRNRIRVRRSAPFGTTTIFIGDDRVSSNDSQPRANSDVGTFFHAFLAQFAGEETQMPFSAQHAGGSNFVNAMNLDAFLTQILNQLSENAGPAPASENRLNSLPTVRVTTAQARDNLQCAICMEEFKEHDEAKRLPCSHHFHEHCVLRWLRMHGTCPTCRVSLDSDDTNDREYFGVYSNQRRSSSTNNNQRTNGDPHGSPPSSRSTLFDFD